MGYARAGFDVMGCDIKYAPDYPYKVLVGDALEVLQDKDFLALFDVIHASPPCQENSRTQHLRNAQGGTVKEDGHDLIGPVRELLQEWGGTWVIENVPGAPMREDLRLDGTMFGLHVRRGEIARPLWRDRIFEFSPNVTIAQPASYKCAEGRPLGVYGTPNDNIPSGGQTCRTVKEAGELMGIRWMRRWDDIKEAIPPVYTEYIGRALRRTSNACGERRSSVGVA